MYLFIDNTVSNNIPFDCTRGTLGGIIVSKLDYQNLISEFKSRRVSHLFSFVPHLGIKLSKLQEEIKSFAISLYVPVCNEYIIWTKQFKPWKVPTVVDSIVVVGVLTCCALLHSMCNLKATQMNVLYSFIWEFMLYEFELGY